MSVELTAKAHRWLTKRFFTSVEANVYGTKQGDPVTLSVAAIKHQLEKKRDPERKLKRLNIAITVRDFSTMADYAKVSKVTDPIAMKIRDLVGKGPAVNFIVRHETSDRLCIDFDGSIVEE